MALRTPPRPTSVAAPAPRRSSSGGKLIFVFLVVVALGMGYLALTDKLPGQETQPTPSSTSGNPPVLIGEDPEYQFLTGDEGAPRVRNCDPKTVVTNKRCG